MFGLALAAALSTLASSEPDRTTAPRPTAPWPAAAAHRAAAEAAPARVQRAADTAPGLHRAPGRPAADPPPYAPGGDDLLPVTPPDAAAPTATRLVLWLDRPRAAVGETVTLQFATDLARGCHGADALQGLTLANGRTSFSARAAGRHLLSVVCPGPLGPLQRSLQLVVPLPVLPDSAANRRLADFDLDTQPGPRQLGLPPLDGREQDSPSDLQTVGDFLQEGRHARFVLAPAGDAAAVAYVLARDDQGHWVDRSAELLPDPADRRTCVGPRQALTTDFNLDGRPDVFVVCHGPTPANGTGAGSPQVLYLSQPDGRWRRTETPFRLQATQAEAYDHDGDGLVDVVTEANPPDAGNGRPRSWVLHGRGDGRFGIQPLPWAGTLDVGGPPYGRR